MAIADNAQGYGAPFLSSVTLWNVMPFRNGVRFRFDPKANVLVGPNGLGKSTALKAFAGRSVSRFVEDASQPQGVVERETTPGDRFDDITAVYVGPTRLALDPDSVLEDLQKFDVEEKVLRILNIVRLVALMVSGAAFVFMIAVLIGQISPEGLLSADDFGEAGIRVFSGVVWGAILFYLLASLARRNLLRLIPDGLLLPSMFRNDSEVSSVFMFRAVQVTNRRCWGGTNREPEVAG